MKWAEEDRSLNREYTRIAAVIKYGCISNDSSNSTGYEVMGSRDPVPVTYSTGMRKDSGLMSRRGRNADDHGLTLLECDDER